MVDSEFLTINYPLPTHWSIKISEQRNNLKPTQLVLAPQ
jgi:hypothetical protein